jgi:EAL domain-containing protein (putative c-di-GMP-specific phosphodiesterase class I)/GGDEF domain-containing protein
VGDKLLVAAAERLARCVRGGDSVAKIDLDLAVPANAADAPEAGGPENSVARLGGDEFTILLDDLSEPEDAVRVARRILTELSRPYQLDGHEVVSTPSIGIVTSGPDHKTAEDLLRDADAAMYRAKTGGKARYAVFDATMHRAAMDRLHMESDLRRAIERDELLLHYQPIISLDDGGLVGFEALLRWRRAGQLVSPGEFIPVAEDMGLIIPIGEWVIEQACRQLAAWRAAHPAAAAGMTMSINLSRRQLGDGRLIPHIRRVLDQTRVGPASVRLEITESVIMDDLRAAGDILGRIKQTGVELSMDDFGTGYSSLICLHRFPIDVLKIDRGFLNGSADQRDVAAVVQAIVTLAHNLGMSVVAEGLERIEQVAFCQALDCDFAQGYVFARPMPADAAEQFLLSPVPLAASA